jgi:hypothetical protein
VPYKGLFDNTNPLEFRLALEVVKAGTAGNNHSVLRVKAIIVQMTSLFIFAP